MIKFLKSLWIPALVVIAFACSEDDPLPLPSVDFTNEIVEVGLEVMFDNLTTNADHYEWTFSDGQSSTAISPRVTFDSPGPVEVVLKAITKDGQIDSLVRNITVRQRYLLGYSVNIFPTKDDGVEWDAGDPDPLKVYPDIFLQLLVDKSNPTNAELDNGLYDGIFSDVSVSSFSRGVGDSGFPENIVLTNEAWGLALFDFDGADVNNPIGTDFTFMTGVTFNPVQAATFKNNDGDGGFISIFFSDGTSTVDFDLYFELK